MKDTAKQLEELKERLLCGVRPETLDPAIHRSLDVLVKLLAAAEGKTPEQLAGMSMADLSKAAMNLQKTLDGMARLRAFAAGGHGADAEDRAFVLKIVTPKPKDDVEDES